MVYTLRFSLFKIQFVS